MAKNYITKNGWGRLVAELKHLKTTERPKTVELISWAASNGDRSENADYQYGKRRLRQIDSRIRFLTKRLEAAELVVPKETVSDKVLFGARVELLSEDKSTRTFQIVGEDEIDIDKGQISWKSPMGRALLGRSVGDEVFLKKPKDEEYFEILSIVYI